MFVAVLHHPLLALAAHTHRRSEKRADADAPNAAGGQQPASGSSSLRNRKKKKAKKAVTVFFGCSLFWHCFPLALGGSRSFYYILLLLLLYFVVSCLKT